MINKRLILTVAVAVTGIAACIIFLAALAPTQSMAAVAADPPVTFPPLGEGKVYAQEEISIHPEPPAPGKPTELCAEVVNNDLVNPHSATLEFGVGPFGIGVHFNSVGVTVVNIPPNGHARGCVWWIPPKPGHWSIEVILTQPGDWTPIEQRSWRTVDVDEPLRLNIPHARPFIVRNPTDETATINLGLVPHVLDWEFVLSEDTLPNMRSGMTQTVILTVTPRVTVPQAWHPVVDVEGFLEGELIGGFRKFYRPPILLHRLPDPPYAESEIKVHPYPPIAGEPTEVCVELYNPTDDTIVVDVQFSWANFGIGIPFTPINGLVQVVLPPHSIVVECIHWIPPVSGHVCLQVEMFLEGHDVQRSQRNLDVAEPLEPGTSHDLTFPVGNPYPDPLTITLEVIPRLPGWEIVLSEDTLVNVQPGLEGVREVTLTVTPPEDMPPDETPIVDVEAWAEGQLIGGFRKIYRPPIPIHRPMDPIYAESEIFVHPYPPRAHEPTEIGVEITNPTDDPQTITVTFSYANFGIGLPWTPINGPVVVTVPPHGMVVPVIMWLPPHEGLWCIQVEIELPDHDEIFWSQRNIDVGEPLELEVPHSRTFKVGNPKDENVTVTLGLVSHLPEWEIDLSQDVLPDMEPDEVREVSLTVTPRVELPPDGHAVVDVEAFVEGELIGGFRKIFRPDVPLHRPKDPNYAESEIGVDPYPAIAGNPTELSVELFNPTDKDQVVTVTFSIAPFGIGLPFLSGQINPNPVPIFVPAHGAARGHTIWIPPWHGKFCVMVELQLKGHDEILWSQRNIDVGEPLRPGEPHDLIFPVRNPSPTDTATVTLGLINHMDDWDVGLSTDELTDMEPGQTVSVTLTVTPPLEVEELGNSMPIVDVEAYIEGKLIGGFRKIDRPPIAVHKPHEKGYAETEIEIDPYPPVKGMTTTVSTVVQNTSGEVTTVELEFGWAKFGMGIPFTNTGMVPYTRSVTLNPGVTATTSISWTPSVGGSQCVLIILSDPEEVYEPQESRRNVHVEEKPPCGEKKVYSFTILNDSPLTATVNIGMITFNVPEGWEVTTVPSDTLELGPYEEGTVLVTVTIPCPTSIQSKNDSHEILRLQAEAGSVPTIDVEGYIDGELVGGIEIQLPAEYIPPYYFFNLPIIRR